MSFWFWFINIKIKESRRQLMNEKYLYENIDNKKVKELIDRIPNDIKKNCKLKELKKEDSSLKGK